MTTTIDIIRHGEPEGGRAYRGHSVDDPLSEKGWQQMWDAIEDHAPWQHIVTSPLRRCRDFAEALSEKSNIPFTIEEQLKEVGFGSWEGKSPVDIQQTDPAGYENFYRDPVRHRPDGAEPLDDFFQRITSKFDDVVQQYKGQHVLIVGHAGVLRAIVAYVLKSEPGGMYRIKVNNAGISRVRYDQYGAKLEFHNSPGLHR